jgi:EAL domain-containing protein (putative c-di-GMP-specific phosphodiesterase class I)
VWVMDRAIRFIGEHLAAHPHLRTHTFGINLSGETLRHEELVQVISETLRKHGVPATMVYFEITETAAIANLGAALEIMRQLRALGCRLALDDFGSGMSSFSYLKNLPVDYLKIDGSFVKGMVDNPVDEAIVSSINAVGQQMGVRTIAEYVESDAILSRLRSIGVDYAQGYAIARPQRLEHLLVQDSSGDSLIRA